MRNHRKSPAPRRRASTGDVLGLVVMERPKVPAKWAEHHAKLLELRDRLAGEKNVRTEHAKDEIPNFSEHMADAATDTYDRDWSLAALSSAQNALYEINEALNRIYTGVYGVCEATGKPIDAARLKAIPWTRYSALAQAQLEAKGQGVRFQLGQLGGYNNAHVKDDLDEDMEEADQREAA